MSRLTALVMKCAPDEANPVAVPTGVAWVNGAPVAIITSTATAIQIVDLQVEDIGSGTGQYEVDVITGSDADIAANAETLIATFANSCSNPGAGHAPGWQLMQTQIARIPTGSKVWLRARDNAATTESIECKLYYVEDTDSDNVTDGQLSRLPTAADALALAPSATPWAWTPWVQLTTGLIDEGALLGLSVIQTYSGSSAQVDHEYELCVGDLPIGDALADEGTSLPFAARDSNQRFMIVMLPAIFPVAAGRPISVRMRKSDTSQLAHAVALRYLGDVRLLPGACSGGGEITIVADPTDGIDTFQGRSPRVRPWLSLDFGNITSDQTGYFALDTYNHPPSYYGGRKRGILKHLGPITRQLSDRFSSYKMGSVSIDVDDTSRFFSQAENADVIFGANSGEFWQNRDGRIHAASPETIVAGSTPHTLFRGIWRSHESDGLQRTIQLIDVLGSEFSDFNLEELHPRKKVRDIFDNAVGIALEAATTDRDALEIVKTANAAAKANREKPLPWAYGKLTDKSVSTIVTPIPVVQTSLATVVANLQASVTAGTTYVDWGGIIGFADAIVLEGLGTVPDTYDALGQVIGYADLDYLLQQSTGGGFTVSDYDSGKGKIAPRYVGYYTCSDGVVRHAWVIADSPIQHVEGRYFDTVAFSADEPDYHDPESADWATVSGTASPFLTIGGYDVTMLFMDQGARANAILSGQSALTLNICGREDVGNASGSTIVSAPRVIFHLLNQSVLLNYRTGVWASPPASSDGVPWLNSQSFSDCETIEVARIGGEGYELAIYLDEQISLRELLGRLSVNTDLRFGQNKHGQIIVKHLDDFLDLTTLETLDDTHDLIAPTKFSRKLEELENATDYDWNYRPADGTFERPDQFFSNPIAITANRGKVAKLDRRQLFYVLHAATATDVAARGLSNASGYVPRYGTFTCNFNVAARVEIGDVVLVTDVDDLGATGQIDRPYWVLGMTTAVGTLDGEPPTVTLFCQDARRFFATIGVWGPDTLLNWSVENGDNRRAYLFWANDTGLFADGAPAKEWR